MAMKELAEEKSVSIDSGLENEHAVKSTNNRHPITWMVFGVVCTLFMTGYWNTVQENRMMKAALTEIEMRSPYQNASMKAFDLYEEVPDLSLPPTLTATIVEI